MVLFSVDGLHLDKQAVIGSCSIYSIQFNPVTVHWISVTDSWWQVKREERFSSCLPETPYPGEGTIVSTGIVVQIAVVEWLPKELRKGLVFVLCFDVWVRFSQVFPLSFNKKIFQQYFHFKLFRDFSLQLAVIPDLKTSGKHKSNSFPQRRSNVWYSWYHTNSIVDFNYRTNKSEMIQFLNCIHKILQVQVESSVFI